MVILKLGLFNNSLYSNFKQLQLALKPVFSTVHSNLHQLQFEKFSLKPHSKCKKKVLTMQSYHRLSLHKRRLRKDHLKLFFRKITNFLKKVNFQTPCYHILEASNDDFQKKNWGGCHDALLIYTVSEGKVVFIIWP